MIQYKLIKEYPGSPKLGKIDWYKTDEFGPSSNSIWQGTNFYDAHPKYWQKVEELDYEILSLIGKNGSVISKENYTFPECFQTLVKASETFKIHSVKRLSDGCVFSIGDIVDNENYTITKIFITENKLQKQGVWLSYQGGSQHLCIALKKLKTPLFTTEDGVEIFDKKTSYYLVSNDFKVCFSSWFSQADLPFKTFSTKEKAEEWILFNQKLLSLNDLLSVWGVSGNIEDYKTAPLFHSFLEVAKSKL